MPIRSGNQDRLPWFAAVHDGKQEVMTLEERARKALEIAADASRYQVCEGCESIVAQRVVTCPNCHGYRFDASASRVISQAKLLGQREQTSVIAEDLE